MMHTRRNAVLAVLAALAVIGGPVAAQELPEAEEEEVVVSARKLPQTRTEVPASVSVITREEIARANSPSVLELIGRQPGVFVGQQGGAGQNAWVQIRGLGGKTPAQNLILIDGHPDFMGIMGHGMPRAQVLDNVERVEIIRGPAATLYGSMALGGLIHIITREAPEQPTAQAWAEGGSFGTTTGQLRAGTTLGRLSFAVSGGHYGTDGHLDNNWAEATIDDFGFNADLRWSPGFVTRFRGRVAHVDTLDQNRIAAALRAGTADAAVPRLHQRFYRRDFGFTNEWRGDGGTATLGLYHNPSEHRFDLPDGFNAEDFVSGITWRHQFRVGAERDFSWGLEWQRSGGKVKHAGWPFPRRNFARSEGAAYAGTSYTLEGGERLSAALRVQLTEGFSPRLLPSVGAEWPAAGGGTFRASLRSGYRTPSFRELYLFEGANPFLRPERTQQIELGYRYPLAGGGEVDLAAYHLAAQDLIQTGPRPAGLPGIAPTANVNVPTVRLYGFELGLRKAFSPTFSGYLNYSYLDPGAAKAYNTAHQGALGADLRRGRLRWSADVQLFYQIWGVDAAGRLTQVPGVVVANTRLSYALGRDYEASLGIDNLFDQHYRLDPALPERMPMPGRSLVFGVRARH
ncbi:MAG: TonB-dependent receptor [Armatimonadetes bacterium]|jgi:outer membrane cobalamin receptor|nr:TonB-dependent receptor [Armatimonadota bacterium]